MVVDVITNYYHINPNTQVILKLGIGMFYLLPSQRC